MTLKNKIITGLIIGLLAVIVGQFFIYKNNVSDLEIENATLEEEKKIAVRKERDIGIANIDTLTRTSAERFDSILNIPPLKIYIPYEKPIFINRTLNDALDIHARNKANKRAAAENR